MILWDLFCNINLLVFRSIYVKIEDIMAEDDEVLDELIHQSGELHQVLSHWDGAQSGAKADCKVVGIHLGGLTEVLIVWQKDYYSY